MGRGGISICRSQVGRACVLSADGLAFKPALGFFSNFFFFFWVVLGRMDGSIKVSGRVERVGPLKVAQIIF
jgi:hypothetical protein